ncbi:MAG: DUF2961 domain-containing protein, partial [Phycisphaerae bacterium]
PTIHGTGSEDYFCNAWGYDTPFCYPFYGAPLLEKRPDGGSFTTVYRWHLADPIRFRKHLRVTIEHTYREGTQNDYASVAFWYQRAPMAKRDPLPRAEDNYPRTYGVSTRPATFDLSGTELEAALRSQGVTARSITANLHEGYRGGGWLQIEAPEGPIKIAIPVSEEGTYRVAIKPVNRLADRPIRLSLEGGEARTFTRAPGSQREVAAVDLGRCRSVNRIITVVIEGALPLGIDAIHVERIDR